MNSLILLCYKLQRHITVTFMFKVHVVRLVFFMVRVKSTGLRDFSRSFIVIFKVSVEAEVPLFFNLVYTADDTRVGISLTSF